MRSAQPDWRVRDNGTYRRYGAVAGLLPSGHVIVAGGKNGRGGTPLARVELWDPEKNEWSPGPSMTRERFLPCACVLPSGRFAVFGGHNDDEINRTGEWGRDDWIVYASAEAYTEADAMPRPLQDQQHDEEHHGGVDVAASVLDVHYVIMDL